MSGRKGAAIWVCAIVIFAAVTLSGGIGIGVSAAAVNAEFQVTNPTLEETEIVEGETATVTTTVENVGNETGTFTAELEEGGEVINATDVEVEAGGTRTIDFIEPFDTAGTYQLSVNGEDAETLTVTEPPSAAFDVTQVTLSEAEVTVGDTVNVTAEIANTGDANGTYTADLAVDGTVRESKSVDIPADETATVSFTRSFETGGDYTIAVNGESAGTLAVSEPAAFEVSSAQLNDESIVVGDDAVVSTEVVNVGESDGTFTAEFRATNQDGTTRTVDTQSVTLAGGESRTVELQGTFEQSGEYDVQVNQTTAGTLTVEPQDNGGSGGGDEPSGSSGSSGSSDSSGASGSSGSDDSEPTLIRSESDEAVTVSVEGVTDEPYEIPLDLTGPSASQPAVSLSSLSIDPAGDRDAYEVTVGGPTAEPNGRDPVSHGTALGYVDINSTLDAESTNAATLQFAIDQEAIPGGLGPADIAVLRYADGEWTTANVAHNVDGDTHTVTLPHATPIAIVALESERVEILESEVPADQVRVGYETTLRATVKNPGDRPVTQNLTVGVNGESVTEREVTLDPGESETIEIRFQPPESGTVSLEGTEAGEIEVFGDNHGTPTDSETDESIPGFGVVAAVLALLVTAFAVRIRR